MAGERAGAVTASRAEDAATGAALPGGLIVGPAAIGLAGSGTGAAWRSSFGGAAFVATSPDV
jgi:hypothetical protein